MWRILTAALVAAPSAGATTLTFDELADVAAYGLTVDGVGFGFTLGGQPYADLAYGVSGPGETAYLSGNVLEGASDGTLELSFTRPTVSLSFGVAESARAPLPGAVTVALFGPGGTPAGDATLDLATPVSFAEAFYVYQGEPVTRASITFDSVDASRFSLDELTFGAAAPEPAALGVLAVAGLLATGLWRRRLAAALAFAAPVGAMAQAVPATGGASLPALSSLDTGLSPALPSAADGTSYELGTAFSATTDGLIETIRWWKAAGEAGAHAGTVWDAATGTALASAAFGPETASGWQTARLASPLPVRAGRTLVVSVGIHSRYADTVGGLATPVGSGYVTTTAGAPAGLYGPIGTFPVSSFKTSNYFTDVTFQVTQTLHAAQAPALPNATDGVPYELGDKFVPATDGQVNALRFYKAVSETGAHTGTLWTAAGQKLASVAFANETASGWQTATLTPPARVRGGQTYMVSVNTQGFFAVTNGGLAAPGIRRDWLSSSVDPGNGGYGPPGAFPRQGFEASDYFRDVVFQPAAWASVPAGAAPFSHRGYLGWIRDLASVPAPADGLWPYLAVDAGLVADYDAAGALVAQAGGTEMEIWGLAGAGGDAFVPGYAVDVERTASAARVATVERIIAGLHAKGLKVVAGTGGMSWGFDQIIAANPSMACPNSPLVANPLAPLSWTYQYRIIDYLFSFGVDGVTIQSGDEGRCRGIAALDAIASDVDYHARIIDPIGQYVRAKYPGAIMGTANYGISFANPADLPFVQRMTAHVDYVNDVGDTVRQQDPAYRARLIAAIAPAQFGTEAEPSPGGSEVHWGPEVWFIPTAQRDVARLQSLYADGGRANENYMRVQGNPGEELSAKLILMYEANPSSDFAANLDAALTSLYHPSTPAALQSLRDIFVTGEDAYFSNSSAQGYFNIENYYQGSWDRSLPFLSADMNEAGRQAYRTQLVALLAEANGLLTQVGETAKLRSVIRCIENTIAEIDEIG